MVTTSRINPTRSLLVLIFLLTVTCAASQSGVMNGLAVSPDGKLILVTYEKDQAAFIYKVSVETGVATRLTKADTGWKSSPSFSADGKQIAYSYTPNKEARSRIIIANVDGSDARQWSPAEVADLSPVFLARRQSNRLLPSSVLRHLFSHRPASPARMEFLRERLGWQERASADDRELLHGIASFDFAGRQEDGDRNRRRRNQ